MRITEENGVLSIFYNNKPMVKIKKYFLEEVQSSIYKKDKKAINLETLLARQLPSRSLKVIDTKAIGKAVVTRKKIDSECGILIYSGTYCSVKDLTQENLYLMSIINFEKDTIMYALPNENQLDVIHYLQHMPDNFEEAAMTYDEEFLEKNRNNIRYANFSQEFLYVKFPYGKANKAYYLILPCVVSAECIEEGAMVGFSYDGGNDKYWGTREFVPTLFDKKNNQFINVPLSKVFCVFHYKNCNDFIKISKEGANFLVKHGYIATENSAYFISGEIRNALKKHLNENTKKFIVKQGVICWTLPERSECFSLLSSKRIHYENFVYADISTGDKKTRIDFLELMDGNSSFERVINKFEMLKKQFPTIFSEVQYGALDKEIKLSSSPVALFPSEEKNKAEAEETVRDQLNKISNEHGIEKVGWILTTNKTQSGMSYYIVMVYTKGLSPGFVQALEGNYEFKRSQDKEGKERISRTARTWDRLLAILCKESKDTVENNDYKLSHHN